MTINFIHTYTNAYEQEEARDEHKDESIAKFTCCHFVIRSTYSV